MKRKIVAVFFACMTVFLLANPASADVHYSGYKLKQFVPSQWPLIALVNHTSTNPNYYHVADQMLQGWNFPAGGTIGGYAAVQPTDVCEDWPNRACVIVVERDMSVSGSVNGCSWNGASNYIGYTCLSNNISATSHVETKATIIMASDKHGYSSAVRVAAIKHEMGHAWGLQHASSGSDIMNSIVDGVPQSPIAEELNCVYDVYHGGGGCATGFASSQLVEQGQGVYVK